MGKKPGTEEVQDPRAVLILLIVLHHISKFMNCQHDQLVWKCLQLSLRDEPVFLRNCYQNKAQVAHTVPAQFTNFKARRNHSSFYVANFLQRLFFVEKFFCLFCLLECFHQNPRGPLLQNLAQIIVAV